jgi:hypothetical protein
MYWEGEAPCARQEGNREMGEEQGILTRFAGDSSSFVPLQSTRIHPNRLPAHHARESITPPRDHELKRDGGQPIVVREEETRGERVRDAVDAWEEQQNSGRPRTGLPRGVGVRAGAG